MKSRLYFNLRTLYRLTLTLQTDAHASRFTFHVSPSVNYFLKHAVRLLRIYFPDGTPIPTSQEIYQEWERLHPEDAVLSTWTEILAHFSSF